MKIQHHAINIAGRDFVVGDLHGERAWLDACLAHVAFDGTRDRLFAVGDLIDRGPDSLGVLALLEEGWFFPVIGNHEAMMVAARDNPEAQRDWDRYGGEWCVGLSADKLDPLRARIGDLPHVRIIGEGAERFQAVHAELTDTIGLVLADADIEGPGRFRKLRSERLLWATTLASRYEKACRGQTEMRTHAPGLSLTFCGHCPVERPGLYESHFFLDGGAGSRAVLPPGWEPKLYVVEVAPVLAAFRRPGAALPA